MFSRALISILVSLFVLGGGFAGYSYLVKPKPQTYIVCKTDLKQCKDGMSVGRVSPSCEFAPCPEERPAGTGGIQVIAARPISGAFEGTMEDVQANGGDYRCTVSIEASAGTATGTILSSQGQLRADFATTIAGGKRAVMTHAILGKESVNAWSDSSKNGIAFARTDAGGRAALASMLPVALDAKQSFSCETWQRDLTAFVLPEGIVWKDLTAPAQ